MSNMFNNTYIDGYIIDDPIVMDIYEVVQSIKYKQFDKAYEIMKNKKLSLEKIILKTQKLKQIDLINFADYLINK